jgi:hypothetical protein
MSKLGFSANREASFITLYVFWICLLALVTLTSGQATTHTATILTTVTPIVFESTTYTEVLIPDPAMNTTLLETLTASSTDLTS